MRFLAYAIPEVLLGVLALIVSRSVEERTPRILLRVSGVILLLAGLLTGVDALHRRGII